MSYNKKILIISIIIIYLMLLIPYTIITNVSNTGEVGIIIERQAIDTNSFPEGIQDLLVYKANRYNIILIDNLITKEKELVLSRETQEEGSFVKIDKPLTSFYVGSQIIPTIEQDYKKIIIGEVKKAEFGGIIETLNYYMKMTNYFSVSILLNLFKIDFLVGGFLVVLVLTLLYQRMVALWNIPAMIALYSFQFFLANLIAFLNGVDMDYINLVFGLLFIFLTPLTIWIKRYEETNGKQKIYGLYIKNKEIFIKVSNKLKM